MNETYKCSGWRGTHEWTEYMIRDTRALSLGVVCIAWKGGVLHRVTYNIKLHSHTHSPRQWWRAIGKGLMRASPLTLTNLCAFACVCAHWRVLQLYDGWHHQAYVLLKEQHSRSGSTQQSQKATMGELNRSVNLISVFWDEIRAKTGMG